MRLPRSPRPPAAHSIASGLRALLALAGLGLAALAPAPAGAQGVAVLVASGLDEPVYVAAPQGDPRLFIVLRAGVIRVLEDGALLPTPFLDITDRVEIGGQFSEGGLLGMAFAPDYAQSGVFYLYYTGNLNPGGPPVLESRVARFTVTGDPATSNAASPASELVAFRLEQPELNHNGGTIAIRDGWLYLGLGDGGGFGDPLDAAQDDTQLLGKMLRFDTAQGTAVPWDYEVWAKGLRNPFRFSFDRLTGDLYIGDVGQATREEINVEPTDSPGGLNYGWDVMEGSLCYDDPGGIQPWKLPCNHPSLVLPIFEYQTGGQVGGRFTRAVTGGAVYRGARSPSMRGTYYFSDSSSGFLWSLRWNPTTGEAEDVIGPTDDLFPPSNGYLRQIVAVAEDGFGELHAVSRLGSVYHLAPEPGPAALGAASLATIAVLARRRRRRAITAHGNRATDTAGC